MDQIRVFVAIELPKEVKLFLSRLLDKIGPSFTRAVKWVDPDGIHLTLKFLGNISPEKVSTVTLAIETAAVGTEPCRLELQELGAFPNLRSPRVIWVGVGGDVSKVANLQKKLDQTLVPAGFSPEKREFSPHLTLGRVRDRATSRERGDLGRLIGSMEVEHQLAFGVARIGLMKSTLTPSGAIYECLASIPLDRRG